MNNHLLSFKFFLAGHHCPKRIKNRSIITKIDIFTSDDFIISKNGVARMGKGQEGQLSQKT